MLKAIELTKEQQQYCLNNRFNYLILFPNGNYKGGYTRKHSARIVNKWNKKNTLEKITSLYNVVSISYVEPRKKQTGIKKLVLYLTGN